MSWSVNFYTSKDVSKPPPSNVTCICMNTFKSSHAYIGGRFLDLGGGELS